MDVPGRASETPSPPYDPTALSPNRQRTHSCNSIGPRFGRDGLHVIGQSVHVHGTEFGARLRRPPVKPDERMLEPIRIVARGIVLARMGAAGFRAGRRAIDGDNRLSDEVVEFER